MRVALLISAVLLTGCMSDERADKRFAADGLEFELPDGWSVTGFSTTVSPSRLVAASYLVRADDVEGDCGGIAAVRRLPAGGAYVVLIDYGPGGGDAREFSDRLPVTYEDGQLAEFGCFGRSHAFLMHVRGRRLQAHIGLGADARPTCEKTRSSSSTPCQRTDGTFERTTPVVRA